METTQKINEINDLSGIYYMLLEINKKIDNLQNDVSLIKSQFEGLETTCNRMDGHINFVEKTYETLKHPINIFKNKIEQVFGKKEQHMLTE